MLTDLNPENLYKSHWPIYYWGADGDTGLTGRKIIVDTYGGAAPHGGGHFQGKIQQKLIGLKLTHRDI